MTIERTFQGAYRISTIKHNQYITKQYMGYSKREALSLFKQYLNSIV